MSPTTIQVMPDLKKRLDEWKIHSRETYEEVIERIMDMATDDEPLSNETIKKIEKSLEDIKAGRIYTEEDIDKEFGLE